MRIFVTGTRGIPSIQGGVESHCGNLYPELSKENGLRITLIQRSAYVTINTNILEYKGVAIKTLYSPKSKSFEAIIHTLLSVLFAAIKRPDILHIHAVGPNLVTPLARLLGLKVVMTHHGPDYERKKWNGFAKFVLKTGERFGVKFANKVIVISDEIGKSIKGKYGVKDYVLIPNGVPLPIISKETDYLQKIGVEPGHFIFTLGRFVPEKGFDYLVKAFKNSSVSSKYKLVIAGDADHESDYSASLKELAKNEGVILTGFIKGEPLNQLFTNTRLFVLPSFYEGLPISLLEAMSYRLDILASDIAANKEVNLPSDSYFETGNVDALTKKLNQKLSVERTPVNYDMSRYNWEKIAKQTLEVYREVGGQ